MINKVKLYARRGVITVTATKAEGSSLDRYAEEIQLAKAIITPVKEKVMVDEHGRLEVAKECVCCGNIVWERVLDE